ncbi:MAG: DUF932 domain-containing protein [Gemmataceae bacterium]|nr:DUF932 domain-containing protein [Gemmataceae bacterium]
MQKTSLVLHTGARSVNREQVAQVATPNRTQTWVPIPHARLLDGVQGCLERAGLSVVNEAHGLTGDGCRYFGLLQVAHADASDFGLVVGLRNSHDKTFPAGLVLGAAIFVCDNLSFSGEVKLARKHTAHVERDLPQLIERAIGKLGDLRRTQDERFASYRQHELTDANAHDLIVRSLDGGVVPVTRLPLVLQEWREPRHPEFRKDRTAWRLFNAFTEALKGNLDMLPRRTQALHGLLDAACGLTVNRN